MGICPSGCKSFIGYYLEPAKLKVKDTVLQRLSSFQMPVANLGVPRVTFTSDQLAVDSLLFDNSLEQCTELRRALRL